MISLFFSFARASSSRRIVRNTNNVVHSNNLAFIGSTSCHRSLSSLSLFGSDSTTTNAQSYHYNRYTNRRLLSSLSSTNNNDDDGDEGDDDGYFSNKDLTFESLGVQSPILLERLKTNLKLTRPTSVQAKTFPVLSRSIGVANTAKTDEESKSKTAEDSSDSFSNADNKEYYRHNGDLTIGSQTGSGKTLAYLLPIFDDILRRKEEVLSKIDTEDANNFNDKGQYLGYDYARAIILVPNKELVQQVIRMSLDLCGGPESLVHGSIQLLPSGNNMNKGKQTIDDEKSTIRLAIMPGGLNELQDFVPFRNSYGLGGNEPPVDIIVATPAVLAPLALSPKNINFFADVQTLIFDEADMLLDGGYLRAMENVLMGFKRADRLVYKNYANSVPKTQHVFVGATIPDYGLKSVDAYIKRKFPYLKRITMNGMHTAKHYGIKNSKTIWIQEEVKKNRMEQLLSLLQEPASENGIQNEKIMVFCNSVEDVININEGLISNNVNSLPYHAKMKIDERTEILDKFRRYKNDNNEVDEDDTVQVLVCTDLASRGMDIPDVNVVVQLEFAGNVVSHLHRMGRCGRASARGSDGDGDGDTAPTARGIIFYNEKEKELVKVVQDAENYDGKEPKLELKQDVDDIEEKQNGGGGTKTVKNAFSRKRGFSKKRKKASRN